VASCCHLKHYHELFPASSGVNLFSVNNEGEKALHLIARRETVAEQDTGSRQQMGHDGVLFGALMAEGLDPLVEDKMGRSALDIASVCGKKDIMAHFK